MHSQLSSRLTADERQAALLQARMLLRASGVHDEALELMDREIDLLNRFGLLREHAREVHAPEKSV